MKTFMTSLRGDEHRFFRIFKSKYVFFNNSASTQTALNRLASNNFVSSWFIWHRYKKTNTNHKNYALNDLHHLLCSIAGEGLWIWGRTGCGSETVSRKHFKGWRGFFKGRGVRRWGGQRNSDSDQPPSHSTRWVWRPTEADGWWEKDQEICVGASSAYFSYIQIPPFFYCDVMYIYIFINLEYCWCLWYNLEKNCRNLMQV